MYMMFDVREKCCVGRLALKVIWLCTHLPRTCSLLA